MELSVFSLIFLSLNIRNTKNDYRQHKQAHSQGLIFIVDGLKRWKL